MLCTATEACLSYVNTLTCYVWDNGKRLKDGECSEFLNI